MPIIYTVIAKGATVLCHHASCTGNFSEVTEQILNKIPPADSKLSYSHGSYLFHYIKENNVVYLCITDDDFERARAFLYLDQIKNQFENTYGLSQINEALPYAMNSEFSSILDSEMKQFSESPDYDDISRVQGRVNELKDIMVKNIDSITSRGERLELLVNKTDNLNTTAITFRKTSRNVSRAMYWKNFKFTLLVCGIGILIIYLIVSFSCGGLSWPNCVGGGNNTKP